MFASYHQKIVFTFMFICSIMLLLYSPGLTQPGLMNPDPRFVEIASDSAKWPINYIPRDIFAGCDLDQDGKKEFIITDYLDGGKVHVFEFQGDNKIDLVWSSNSMNSSYLLTPRSVKVADLDNNGRLEILAPNAKDSNPTSYGLYVYEWDGVNDNGYGNGSPIAIYQDGAWSGGSTETIAVDDLDNDGRQEVVYVNDGNDDEDIITIFSCSSGQFSQGNASWLQEAKFARSAGDFSGSPRSTATGDLDRDGNKEAIVGCYDFGALLIVESTSANQYVKRAYFQTSPGTDDMCIKNIIITDFDNDGKDDILFNMFNQKKVGVVYNINTLDALNTNAQVTFVFETTTPSAGFGMAYSDQDGNGQKSIFLTQYVNGGILEVEYKGSGDRLNAANYNVHQLFVDYSGASDGSFAIAAPEVDLDGDGHKEVVASFIDGSQSTSKKWFRVFECVVPPPTPILSISPTTLDFGTDKTSLTFDIVNAGSGQLWWSVVGNPPPLWLADIVPLEGYNDATVTVTVDRSQLTEDSDTGSLHIYSNGGEDNVTMLIAKQQGNLPGHWDYVDRTGNSANVILNTNANPNIAGIPLLSGDYVGVFTPAELCCGWKQWDGSAINITVWGDNNETTETDGFKNGETIHYRVYRMSTMEEWTTVEVAYSEGDGAYVGNAFMVLSKFDVKGATLPPDWDFTDRTGNSANVILNTDANPNIDGSPLMVGDYIGVFTPAGMCCGWKQWDGNAINITVWGDNNETTETDGFKNGETIHYRVFRLITLEEWTTVDVAYSEGDGSYVGNAFLVLSKFDVKGATLPADWDFTDRTGTSANVILNTDANPNIDGSPLMVGDYIGVFTPAGLCCGWKQWDGNVINITVWGDNNETTETDGFKSGELINYRVYRFSKGQEWRLVEVAYSEGDGYFTGNAFMVLSKFDVKSTSVKANDDLTTLPERFALFQNHPNPFNPVTTIGFQLPFTATVKVTIYDALGCEIRYFLKGSLAPGYHEVLWDGNNHVGQKMASGIYFYRLEAKGDQLKKQYCSDVKKMILVK